MSSYRPMSVAEAGAIIGPKIGLTWSDNRREIVDYLNRYRNLLYNRYERQQLFNDVTQCFCLQTFRNLCRSCDPCSNFYVGFTLPRDMASVVQVWEYNMPLRVRSAWREHYTGLAPWHGARQDVVEMPDHYPTERVLPAASSLKMFCESMGDNGKLVVVKVKDTDTNTKKLEFTLAGEGWVQHEGVEVADIISVQLPPDRTGCITLTDFDGYELSRYSPAETSPAYKRYKVPGNCHGAIMAQGARQYVEVYFDEDLVEIGDRMVLEFMGRYFKYYESKDQKERIVAQQELTNAFANLDGLVNRDEGGRLPQPTLHARNQRPLPGQRRFYPTRLLR